MTEEKSPLHVATRATAPGESGLSRQMYDPKVLRNVLSITAAFPRCDIRRFGAQEVVSLGDDFESPFLARRMRHLHDL